MHLPNQVKFVFFFLFLYKIQFMIIILHNLVPHDDSCTNLQDYANIKLKIYMELRLFNILIEVFKL